MPAQWQLSVCVSTGCVCVEGVPISLRCQSFPIHPSSSPIPNTCCQFWFGLHTGRLQPSPSSTHRVPESGLPSPAASFLPSRFARHRAPPAELLAACPNWATAASGSEATSWIQVRGEESWGSSTCGNSGALVGPQAWGCLPCP